MIDINLFNIPDLSLLFSQKYIFSELSQELTSFKTETARVQEIKRKLQFEKDKLSRELREFEQQRQAELKKIEEERRKLKRDKLLLDKVYIFSYLAICERSSKKHRKQFCYRLLFLVKIVLLIQT